jgi:hypothetical protein
MRTGAEISVPARPTNVGFVPRYPPGQELLGSATGQNVFVSSQAPPQQAPYAPRMYDNYAQQPSYNAGFAETVPRPGNIATWTQGSRAVKPDAREQMLFGGDLTMVHIIDYSASKVEQSNKSYQAISLRDVRPMSACVVRDYAFRSPYVL